MKGNEVQRTAPQAEESRVLSYRKVNGETSAVVQSDNRKDFLHESSRKRGNPFRYTKENNPGSRFVTQKIWQKKKK